MKKIGLVGGVAWTSTVEYYSEISRRATLEMSIESLDLGTALSYVGNVGDEESWARFDDYHRKALLSLEARGAGCAAIASNTPHERFDAITRGLKVPVIDLFEVLTTTAAGRGVSAVALLGTRTTMRSARLRSLFGARGIEVLSPADSETETAVLDVIEKLQHGLVEGSAGQVASIAKEVLNQSNSSNPAVCLACTELPLAFSDCRSQVIFSVGGITYISSAAAHIDAIIRCACED
jgi:aspartate racemase